MNVNIPGKKVGAIQSVPKAQNGEFLKESCNDFNQIAVINAECLPQ
jgi:hypothetical protein